MAHQTYTLNNGLRVLTQHLPGTEGVTIMILVGAGSRYEHKAINGLSHFLEHMFFKGGQKYPDTKSVSQAIDNVGGSFNAFTGKEYAGYFVRVAAPHLPLAADVLSDMLLTAKLDDQEINKERGVIMEEYNMYQDTPMYQVAWDFERLVFGDHPLGWDQVGTEEVINRVTHRDFTNYKQQLYTPDNTVIAICGNVGHDPRQLIEQYFSFAGARQLDYTTYTPGSETKTVLCKHKTTEQAHLVLGYEGVYENHPQETALKIAAAILGGNMSSRMFLRIREQQGLCYYIQTAVDSYLDTGLLYTRAGVNRDKIEHAISSIKETYQCFLEDMTETEVRNAKEFLKGKLILGHEDSEELAHFLGKQELLHHKVKTIPELLQQIEETTYAEVQQAAQEIIGQRPLRLSLIGPYADEAKLIELIR